MKSKLLSVTKKLEYSTYYYTRVYPKVLPDQVSQSIYGQNYISGGALKSWAPADFKTDLEIEFWTRFKVDNRLTNTDTFFCGHGVARPSDKS